MITRAKIRVPTYQVSRFLWEVADWVFPPICGGCSQPGFRWCPNCQDNLTFLPEPSCPTCAEPTAGAGQCSRCLESPPAVGEMRSWVLFEGPIRNALHTLKYRQNLGLGIALAEPVARVLRSYSWQVDMLIPVPLGRKRKVERGYNQVDLVARPVSAINNWDYQPRAMARTRETKSQVGLSIKERRTNVVGAFNADPELVGGKNILVMDDVTTTGATLHACALSLREAGANRVFAFSLAKAAHHHVIQDGLV